MDYLALEKSLQRQLLSPLYLFYGEETYLRDRMLERFKALLPGEVRDFNLDIIDGNETDITAIINAAVTLPFMAERRLVIVKNADFFKARRRKSPSSDNGAETGDDTADQEKASPADDALLKYLDNPPVTTCLIFCTDSVDKKRKIFKMLQKNGQVVDFSPLKGRDLNEWINKRARQLGKVMEPAAMAVLVTAVGNDLRQLNTELEKLACHAAAEKIAAADVEIMVSKTAELSIFDLVDAVGERKYKKAIRMAREMVFLGEPVIRLIYMITRQFRLIIQAKALMEAGYTPQHVVENLRVHQFVAQKCVRQAGNFHMPELQKALAKILSADADIKQGRQDPVLALELLIISLCEK